MSYLQSHLGTGTGLLVVAMSRCRSHTTNYCKWSQANSGVGHLKWAFFFVLWEGWQSNISVHIKLHFSWWQTATWLWIKGQKGRVKEVFPKCFIHVERVQRGQEVNVFCKGPHKRRQKEVFESASCWPPAVREVRARCWGEFGSVLHEHTPVNYSCARTDRVLCPHAGPCGWFWTKVF